MLPDLGETMVTTENGGDASPSKSPKKRKASKSPKKKEKVVDPYLIELINWKTSAKIKGRLVVADKIDIPADILEYIET